MNTTSRLNTIEKKLGAKYKLTKKPLQIVMQKSDGYEIDGKKLTNEEFKKYEEDNTDQLIVITRYDYLQEHDKQN